MGTGLDRGAWKKLIFDDEGNWSHPDLEDHYFYLVAHKKFATPMKAKYHDDGDLRCFQIMSVSNDICTRHNFDDVYPWDNDITHFMDLPDMPDADFKYGDDKFWKDESQK